MLKKLFLLFALVFASVSFAKLPQSPRVSVIIPIYNSEKWIEQCLDSVINQTYKNLEIILIDDKSTDDTYNILKRYTANDKRIRLYQNKINSKQAFTRNKGIDVATGEYLYFMDSDDWLDLGYIEEMVRAMDGVELVVNRKFSNTTEDGLLLKKTNELKDSFATELRVPSGIYNRDEINEGMSAFIMNKMFRRQIVQKNRLKFPVDMSFYESGVFNCMYLSFVKKISIINTLPYYYRIRNNSITAKSGRRNRKFKKWGDILLRSEYLYEFYKKNKLFNKLRICTVDDIFFVEVIRNKEEKEEFYSKMRENYLKISPFVKSHPEFYDQYDFLFFKRVLKYEKYKDFYGTKQEIEKEQPYSALHKSFMKKYKDREFMMSEYEGEFTDEELYYITNVLRFTEYRDFKSNSQIMNIAGWCVLGILILIFVYFILFLCKLCQFLLSKR